MATNRFRFGDCEIDLRKRELGRNGASVSVEPQVFDLLAHLLRHRDRVVGRDELLAEVWKGRHVSEATLDSRVNAARRAVGDSGAEQRIIRTVPRRGFRFVADLAPVLPAGSPSGHAEEGAVRAFSAAVLPFPARPAGDPATEGLAAALTDALAAELPVAVPGLSVLAGAGAPAATAFRLEGSVERWEGSLRAQLRLADQDGAVLGKWRHEAGSAADLVDQTVALAAAGLERPMVIAAGRRAGAGPEGLLLRARAAAQTVSPEGYAAALDLFREAARAEPRLAPAWAGAAFALAAAHLNLWPWATPEGLDEAEASAERAVALDPSLALARLALGFVLRLRGRQEAALAALERACALNPHAPLAQSQAALQAVYLGDAGRALAAMDRAVAFGSRDASFGALLAHRGLARFVQGDLAGATADYRRAELERPDMIPASLALAALHQMAGREAEARDALATLRRRHPSLPLGDALRRWPAFHPSLAAPVLRRWQERLREALREAGLEDSETGRAASEDPAERLDP